MNTITPPPTHMYTHTHMGGGHTYDVMVYRCSKNSMFSHIFIPYDIELKKLKFTWYVSQ